jgi:hypothetical protein
MGFAAIDTGALIQVVWASLLAGIGVTLTFSLVVLGSTRSAAARRRGSDGAALAYGVLAALALGAFVAGVIFGLIIMLSKD